MNSAAPLIIGGVVLVGLAAYARANMAMQDDNTTPEDAADVASLDVISGASALSFMDAINPFSMANKITSGGIDDANVAAFLRMLMVSEGTARAEDPYAVCYGYRHRVQDWSDHPAIADGWRGESLVSLGAAYVGKVSTAAGAYQVIKPTWLDAKRSMGLPDFRPASQDAAAVWLIDRRCKALGDIKAGRLVQAISKCASQWASLPGSTSGQPQSKLATLRDVYASAGGSIA